MEIIEVATLGELKKRISRFRRGVALWQQKLGVSRQTFYGYFWTETLTKRRKEVLEVGKTILLELESSSEVL